MRGLLQWVQVLDESNSGSDRFEQVNIDAVGAGLGGEGVKVEKATQGHISGSIEGGGGMEASAFDSENITMNISVSGFGANGILFDNSLYCMFSGVSRGNGRWGVRGTGDYNLVDGAVVEGNTDGQTNLDGASSNVGNII